jgi:predicted nucleotidyltransferase
VAESEGETAVDRLATLIADLPEVRLAFLFGSRARGRGRADSDFDIGVLLSRHRPIAGRS